MSETTSTPGLMQIAHRQPTDTWLQASREEALDPDRRIIDAHHHFSEHWGGYMPPDLLEDFRGHRVEATVYVQCAWKYRTGGPEALKPVGETTAVIEVTEDINRRQSRTQVAAAIVGYADLRLGAAVDEVLSAQVEAGQGRFRGVRNSGAFHDSFKHGVLARPMKGLYGDAAFRAGYARLARHGLSFDAWIYHPQLNEVIDLARAHPEVPLVLDHIGGVLGVAEYRDRPDLASREWLPAMKELAKCPNVFMKLGGLGTAVFGYDFADRPQPPSSQQLADAWQPWLEPAIELFGAQRCMFESNFPVDRSAAGYGVVWNAFKRLAAGASEAEKQWLFAGTASHVYRIPMAA